MAINDMNHNYFYVLQNELIESSRRYEKNPGQEIYLSNGYLECKARIVGGVTDYHILRQIEQVKGFKEIIDQIGVSIILLSPYKGKITLALQGQTVDNVGAEYRLLYDKDGEELFIPISEISCLDKMDALSCFLFEFEEEGVLAQASIRFFLTDDYKIPIQEEVKNVDFLSNPYEEMVKKSLLYEGNTIRIKKAFQKLLWNEGMTVAFIGGSITQGAGAKPIHKSCYANQCYEGIKRLAKEKLHCTNAQIESIKFIKAGVGGTPSELGVIRYERDILRDGMITPDLLIVEFAVNDADDETEGDCYESLVRKVLYSSGEPAVILLFSVFENGWNLQDRLKVVGYQYKVPMVSIKDAVKEQFDALIGEKIVSKEQYFFDMLHPSNIGHKIMADCLLNLMKEVLWGNEENLMTIASQEEDYSIFLDGLKPVIGNTFEKMKLLDRSHSYKKATISEGDFIYTDKHLQMVELDDSPYPTKQFMDNWQYVGNKVNPKPFSVVISASSLILVFKDSERLEFGQVEIWVDGKYSMKQDPRINNWTHCHAVLIFQNSPGDHVVEIKISKGCEQSKFTVLGFGYVE